MANEEEVTPENAGESIEFDNVSQDNDLDCLKEPEQPLGGMDEAVSGAGKSDSVSDVSSELAALKKANGYTSRASKLVEKRTRLFTARSSILAKVSLTARSGAMSCRESYPGANARIGLFYRERYGKRILSLGCADCPRVSAHARQERLSASQNVKAYTGSGRSLLW